MTELLTLQRRLVKTLGVTGHEENRASVIKEMVAQSCDDVTIDNMFNVIAHKKGPGARVMLSAHMDTIGVLVTFIEEDGSLRFDSLGGLSPLMAIDTLVRFENGTTGRICLSNRAPLHSTKASDLALGYDLYIDIGARDKQDAERLVRVGDVAQYAAESICAGSDSLLSPYLDDLVACAIQIMVMERLRETVCPNDIYFVFSTQEEVGHRGAKAAARAINPQFGLALDVTRAGDERGNRVHMDVSLGGGAAIKVKDSSVISTLSMVQLLKQAAIELGISYQIEVLERGGTDTEAIQNNGTGAAAAGISIPCRYTHTPSEMVSLADVHACVDLVCAVLTKSLNGGGL
jgi:putative aminopeptidase FrvX